MLLAGLGLFGCSSGGSNPAPVVATITSTDPPDGALGVAPSATIRFVLAAGGAVLNASDLVVTDGGNTLPGTLRRVDDSHVWEWTPTYELPRGCEIQVGRIQESAASNALQILATFTVRDSSVAQEFELADEAPEFSLSWPNGRSAIVTASGNVFEVTPTGLLQRFAAVMPGARAYGDGDFICEEDVGAIHFCVRGNLDGTSTRVATPFGAAIGGSNANGDVVAHVTADVGVPSDWGLWRWMRGDPGFAFAGSVFSESLPDTPSIQLNGIVSLAYPLGNRVRLSRFGVGDVVGEHHELVLEGGCAHFDSADDGRGLLAFTVYTPATATAVPRVSVHVARYEPITGLTMFPTEIAGWDQLLPSASVSVFQRIDDVRVGDLGSGCVLLADGSTQIGSSGSNTFHDVVRVEPDDRVADKLMYMLTIGQQPMERSLAQISPARAEVWSMSDFWEPARTWWLRSRPGDVRLSVLYKNGPLINPVGPWCFSFDDSGRGLLALSEGSVDNPSTRIVVVN
jgi:hypothetical protein